MNELLKKDVTIKIVAILMAVYLWFFVLDTENPIKTRSITVPVKILHESTLQEKGIIVKNKDYLKSVDITIKGRKKTLDNVSINDFTAEMDFSKIKDASDKQIVVDGPTYIGKEEVQIEKGRSQALSLDLEKIGNNTFPVEVVTEGVLKDKYRIIKQTVTPETITIDGTDSLIKSIASVKTVVNVSGLDETLDIKKKECAVLDKNGKPVSIGKKYNVDIKLEVAKEVPLTIEVKGKPAKNYIEASKSVNPDKVLITGAPDVLAKINELIVDPVDVENASESINEKCSIKLPDGVKLVDTSDKVSVSVKIEQLAVKDFVIPSDTISFINTEIDNSLKYEIQTKEIIISAKGNKADLEQLDISKLSPQVDVNGLSEGLHKVILKLSLPDDVKLAKDYELELKIDKR